MNLPAASRLSVRPCAALAAPPPRRPSARRPPPLTDSRPPRRLQCVQTDVRPAELTAGPTRDAPGRRSRPGPPRHRQYRAGRDSPRPHRTVPAREPICPHGRHVPAPPSALIESFESRDCAANPPPSYHSVTGHIPRRTMGAPAPTACHHCSTVNPSAAEDYTARNGRRGRPKLRLGAASRDRRRRSASLDTGSP